MRSTTEAEHVLRDQYYASQHAAWGHGVAGDAIFQTSGLIFRHEEESAQV